MVCAYGLEGERGDMMRGSCTDCGRVMEIHILPQEAWLMGLLSGVHMIRRLEAFQIRVLLVLMQA